MSNASFRPAVEAGAPLVDFQPASRHWRSGRGMKWDIATPDAIREGEAIDVLTGDDMRALPPIGLVAALAVEATVFGAEGPPLIAFGDDNDGEAAALVARTAPDNGEDLVHAWAWPAGYDGSEAVMLHNFVSHGVSLDWTDAMVGYS